MLKRTVMMAHLQILVAALATAGVSTPNDAPDSAHEIWGDLVKQTCANPEEMTVREARELFRAVLRKALEITEASIRN